MHTKFYLWKFLLLFKYYDSLRCKLYHKNVRWHRVNININPTALLVLLACVIIGGIITGLFFVVKSIISAIKSRNITKLKFIIASVLIVITTTISWIFNMGWIRFILTFLAVPVVHTTAFIIISAKSLTYIDKSVRLKVYVLLYYITYLLGYIFLPDCGDYGPMYTFFGLIHNNAVVSVSFYLSALALQGNIVLFILMIIETVKLKKRIQQTKCAWRTGNFFVTQNAPLEFKSLLFHHTKKHTL